MIAVVVWALTFLTVRSCNIGFALFQKYNVSMHGVYCVEFRPNKSIAVHGIKGWRYYVNDMVKFTSHLSQQMNLR